MSDAREMTRRGRRRYAAVPCFFDRGGESVEKARDMNFVTIILAAGLSSRMGRLKALLPFAGGEAAIRQVVRNAAKLGRVVVVTGHEAQAIAEQLKGLPVELCHNETYLRGMFTSVQAGVRRVAQSGADAFFLLPVDYTLVTADIMRRLAEEFARCDAPIVYPALCGKKGHPPLIGAQCIPDILSHDGTDGLKGALSLYEKRARLLELNEPAVLDDMDTMEDYARMSAIREKSYAYRHIFLQGDIYVGKSTLIEEAVRDVKKELGGFTVKRGYHREGRCNSFSLESVRESFLPAKKRTSEEERMFMRREGAGWVFIPEVFEGWAARLLMRERRFAPMFLLDEVGGMELQCPSFARQLHLLLAERPCIGVFKQLKNSKAQSDAMDTGTAYQRTRGLLVEQIVRTGGRIITLGNTNKEEILGELQSFLAGRTAVEFAKPV